MYRKITDYFSMFLLMPILIVVSGGLSIFMSTMLKQMDDFVLLAPIMKFMIRLIPFVLTWLMFTGLYIFMPNTKVKFKHALIAGVLAGTAYQAFQYLYISSQLGVSKYNAIVLPLYLYSCFGCKYPGLSVCSVRSWPMQVRISRVSVSTRIPAISAGATGTLYPSSSCPSSPNGLRKTSRLIQPRKFRKSIKYRSDSLIKYFINYRK